MMARKRYITSEMSNDEKVAEAAAENPVAALMWPWFIKEMDDWARMSANPKELKLKVFQAFPFSAQELQDALEVLATHELVVLYSIEGRQYLQANPEAYYKLQTYIQKTRMSHDGSKLPPPNHQWGRHWITSDWYGVQQKAANVAENVHQLANGVLSPSPSPTPSNTKGNAAEDSALSPEAHRIAKELYDWLKEQDALPAAKGWYMKQVGVAQHVLLPSHSVDEWLSCLSWAKRDGYWSVNLTDLGQLGRTVWAQYIRNQPHKDSASGKPFVPSDGFTFTDEPH